MSPKDRHQTCHDCHNGHHFGSHAINGTDHDRGIQLLSGEIAALGAVLGFGQGVVKIDQHDYTRLCRDPCQRDEPDGDRDRHVESHEPHQPDPPDKGKG